MRLDHIVKENYRKELFRAPQARAQLLPARQGLACRDATQRSAHKKSRRRLRNL